MEDSDEIDIQENQPASALAGQAPKAAPEWKPITAKQRRVLGTLMEKSKTTPDAYPMTFAGLCTGCNQKSNRAPISNYSSEQVETIVDELRAIGALTIVQGLGRNTKVRHYAYNWLAISKVEAAVMTELLLRGEQTLGELRTRAARMEPINDLQHMTDLFNELKRRNLVVELSPPGRGQIVSHNLYPEWELEQVRKSVAAGISASGDADEPSSSVSRSAPSSAAVNVEANNRIKELESELVELKESISDLQTRLSRLEKDLGVN
ncbi:MAG: DUF480 domain-containing protein [Planctomycetota bacterium]|nr:DUF480 domain-containing protein [Planctomycetota bacterium]